MAPHRSPRSAREGDARLRLPSLALLVGFVLNATAACVGRPGGALLMVPWLVKEGREGLRGEGAAPTDGGAPLRLAPYSTRRILPLATLRRREAGRSSSRAPRAGPLRSPGPRHGVAPGACSASTSVATDRAAHVEDAERHVAGRPTPYTSSGLRQAASRSAPPAAPSPAMATSSA